MSEFEIVGITYRGRSRMGRLYSPHFPMAALLNRISELEPCREIVESLVSLSIVITPSVFSSDLSKNDFPMLEFKNLASESSTVVLQSSEQRVESLFWTRSRIRWNRSCRMVFRRASSEFCRFSFRIWSFHERTHYALLQIRQFWDRWKTSNSSSVLSAIQVSTYNFL